MKGLHHSTSQWGLVIIAVMVAVACDLPTQQEVPEGVPFQPSATGYDGYMIVFWSKPGGSEEDDAEGVTYGVRYRRLEHWIGDPVEGWRYLTTDKLRLRIDLESGSYESQVRAHRDEVVSIWWRDPPMKTYVR